MAALLGATFAAASTATAAESSEDAPQTKAAADSDAVVGPLPGEIEALVKRTKDRVSAAEFKALNKALAMIRPGDAGAGDLYVVKYTLDELIVLEGRCEGGSADYSDDTCECCLVEESDPGHAVVKEMSRNDTFRVIVHAVDEKTGGGPPRCSHCKASPALSESIHRHGKVKKGDVARIKKALASQGCYTLESQKRVMTIFSVAKFSVPKPVPELAFHDLIAELDKIKVRVCTAPPLPLVSPPLCFSLCLSPSPPLPLSSSPPLPSTRAKAVSFLQDIDSMSVSLERRTRKRAQEYIT